MNSYKLMYRCINTNYFLTCKSHHKKIKCLTLKTASHVPTLKNLTNNNRPISNRRMEDKSEVKFINSNRNPLQKYFSRTRSNSESMSDDYIDEDSINDELGLGQHDFTESDSLHDLGEQQKREFRRHQAFIKEKIIARKYFKTSKEDNILSWAAKQQIMYLNSEDPDEWTVENLAQTFPVSADVIRKILKSNYDLSEREQSRHDKKAQDNVGSLSTEERDVIGAERLANAAGAPGLPMPTLTEKPVHAPGLFESIIVDYNNAVTQIQQNNVNTDVKMKNMQKFITGQSETQPQNRNLDSDSDLDSGYPRKPQANKHTQADRSGYDDVKVDGENLNVQNEGMNDKRKLSRRERRLGEEIIQPGIISNENMQDLAMKGTGKIK